MREAGAPNTRKLLLRLVSWCARLTGDSYGRTTDSSAQRFNGANLRATLEVGYEMYGHARSGVRKAQQGHYKGRSPCKPRPGS
jgi:hypothetical protein